MQNWEIVLTCTYPHEAHMAKTYLEAQGIEVILKDEWTAQVDNFYSNAIGGVKLLIRESDFQNGLETLKAGGYIRSDTHVPVEEQLVPTGPSTDKKVCPFCASRNIAKKRDPNVLVIVVYFLLGAFFPLFKRGYRCFDCGKEWKYTKKNHKQPLPRFS